MKIYAYYNQLSASYQPNETLEIWKKSWEKMGWEPVVLSEKDAENHPLYEQFSNKLKTFPTVNTPGFDYHAFMRWLAVPAVGGILSTEPDVINYSLKPSDVEKYLGLIENKKLQCHSPVPAFLIGSPVSYENVCKKIINHCVQPEDNVDGRPHLSDQDFSYRYCDGHEVEFYRTSELCCELFDGDIFNSSGTGTTRWKTAPVVHYGTPYMMTHKMLPKHEYIHTLRQLNF
jgi:hypothetical protein